MVEMKLLKDNSEIVPYNFPNFQVHARKYLLSYYPNMAAVSHWHADFEFIVMLRGKMLYSVNGKDYLLEEGQSIFVNTKQLHYGHSFEKSDCEFLCLLFHPSLLYSTENIKETFVEAICQNDAFPFLIFTSSDEWQNNTIAELKQIFNICQEQSLGFELAVLSHFYSLWLNFYQNVVNIEKKEEPISDKRLETLHSMIGYIQKHYCEKLVLSDIAAAGSVCRSSCCDIFSSLLHMTPVQYLTNYRLEKSIEYLHHTGQSITDVALLCGFNSSSYFTEVFHRELGYTPSQYKDKIKNSTING